MKVILVIIVISKQGIHPSIRGEVWEFLLGCFDPKSSYDEREDIRQRRRCFPFNIYHLDAMIIFSGYGLLASPNEMILLFFTAI